jgi:hypothetical protein
MISNMYAEQFGSVYASDAHVGVEAIPSDRKQRRQLANRTLDQVQKMAAPSAGPAPMMRGGCQMQATQVATSPMSASTSPFARAEQALRGPPGLSRSVDGLTKSPVRMDFGNVAAQPTLQRYMCYAQSDERSTEASSQQEHVSDDDISPASSTQCHGRNAQQQEDNFNGEDHENVTTFMIRNIPCRCTQAEVLGAIEEVGFAGAYDFFYLPSLPTKRGMHQNQGYAFIGLSDPTLGSTFVEALSGYFFKSRQSKKSIVVAPARLQGQAENMANLKNTRARRSKQAPIFIKSSAPDACNDICDHSSDNATTQGDGCAPTDHGQFGFSRVARPSSSLQEALWVHKMPMPMELVPGQRFSF